MYRRMRKPMALALVAAMMMGALTGCGGDTQKAADDGVIEKVEPGEVVESESAAGDDTTDAADTSETTGETAEESTEEETKYVIPEVSMEHYDVPDTEAFQFVKNMKIGFNLGNTFDAFVDGSSLKNELDTETSWQTFKTSEQMIRDIHAAGFETIRIPVSWHNHFADDDYTISEQWLARVHEVVDWAINDGMYVIINIHHDNHEEANAFYPDSAHIDQSKHYIERIWTQLSEEFADYDEKLIFESMNEPRLINTDYEWWINNSSDECKDAISCINELNQTFVDTVRASGGKNETRYLMCPGYDASADGALHSGYVLPTDKEGVTDRIMVSVHAYTPYDFALNISGTAYFDAATKSCTNDIDVFMDKLYKKFIENGVPVVIGEFGALAKRDRENGDNVQARVDYAAYYIAAARARGMSCLWWDNNAFSGNGENFGLYYRTGGYFIYQDIVDALMKYADAVLE